MFMYTRNIDDYFKYKFYQSQYHCNELAAIGIGMLIIKACSTIQVMAIVLCGQ